MHTSRNTVALIALAAVVLAACGGAARSTKSGGARDGASKPGSRPSPGSHFTGYINGVYYVDGKPTPLPSPPKRPKAQSSPPASPPTVPDFVKIQWDLMLDESWGEDCLTMRRGADCGVPFIGIAYLGTADRGKIVLQAFENGLLLPAATRVLEPARKGSNTLCVVENCPFGGARLLYRPSATAEYVSFRVEVQNSLGTPLAFQQSGNYPVYAS